MTYGAELNAFRANADKYGDKWRGLVIARNPDQLRLAMDDAKCFLGGRLFSSACTLVLHNGARIIFRVAADENGADTLRGMRFSQIMWLYRPEDPKLSASVRAACLRAPKDVPQSAVRYEYVAL